MSWIVKARRPIKRLANALGYNIVPTNEFRNLLPNLCKDGSCLHYKGEIGEYYFPPDAEGDLQVRRVRQNRINDPEIVEVAKRYIYPGTTVLDLGANFGQMSIEFAKLTGPGGWVYCFEAQKKVYEYLARNLDANRANVFPRFNAVYNEDMKILSFPEADLTKHDSYGWFGVEPKTYSALDPTVLTITIDSLACSVPISFMKVDVEGSDLFALHGARNTIMKHRMPILFEYNQEFQEKFGTNFNDYVYFVDDIGYKFIETVLGVNYLIVPK